MSLAFSIHVGVNRPRDGHVHGALRDSEQTAWRMAELASQAGYDSLLVLRGAAATRQAVHEALARAAGTLQRGDVMLVTFSGHGSKVPDREFDDRDGFDESWCLYDGVLLDDRLAGYWRLFEPGVRIVVVSESCYSGGIGRTGPGRAHWTAPAPAPVMRGGTRGGHRGPRAEPGPGAFPGASCIGEPPRDSDEIRASVLLLTASGEHQTAQEGLFSEALLDVWAGGEFGESYCELYRRVRERVMRESCSQEPQILMLGAPDPEFPLLPAFHRQGGARQPPAVYR